MANSSYPNAKDVFPGFPYVDFQEYLYAAYANAWVNAITAVENTIGSGTGSASPLFSNTYAASFPAGFPNLKSRFDNIEANLAAVPPVDLAAGDIQPVGNFNAASTHPKTLTHSVTAITTSGNNWVLTFDGDVSQAVQVGRGIVLSNFTPAGYNGSYIIVAVSGTQVTINPATIVGAFASAGTVQVQTGSGQVADATHQHQGVWLWNGRLGFVTPAAADYSASMVTGAADKLTTDKQSFLGRLEAPGFAADGFSTSSGLGSRYIGGSINGPPTESNPNNILTGGFNQGDLVVDRAGTSWVCKNGGSPGVWVGRPALSVSMRIYPTTDIIVPAGSKTRITSMTVDSGINQGSGFPGHTVIEFAPGANSLLVHQTGVYRVSWRIAYRTAGGGIPDYGEYIATLNFNGDNAEDQRQGDAGGGGANGSTPCPGGVDDIFIPAGTYVQLFAKQFNQPGSSQNAWGDPAQTWLSLTLLDAVVVPAS